MKFDHAALTYDKWAVHQADAADMLLTLPGIPPEPASLLDLGCGTGLTSLAAHGRWPHIALSGLDISTGMLGAYQRRFPTARVIHQDMQAMEPIHQYDLVISSFAFQWVEDIGALFSKVLNLLTPDGRLAFAEPVAGSLPEFAAACEACGLRGLGLNFRTVETIHAALRKAGFRIVSTGVEPCSHRYANSLRALKVFKYLGAVPMRRTLSITETRQLIRLMKPSLTYQVAYFVATHE